MRARQAGARPAPKRRRRGGGPAGAAALLASFSLFATACSPLYLLRAGYEEARILWHRRPIEEVLARPGVDGARRKKLEIVLDARRFAVNELGFRRGESYQSIVELAQPPTVHVVSAAYRHRLEPYTWWFPVIGRVAYKGFFSERPAASEVEKLEARGYDTYVRTAATFSTLGWFADPLFPHLLNYDEVTLANVVFHELFHETFYRAGQTAFNESLANFAGSRAAIDFFLAREGPHGKRYREAVAAWEDELGFAAFLREAAQRLRACYDSSKSGEEALAGREEVFAGLKQEFGRLTFHTRSNGEFARERLNNAVLLHYLLYRQELDLFEDVYRRTGGGLRQALDRIIALAREAQSPFDAVRDGVEKSADTQAPAAAS